MWVPPLRRDIRVLLSRVKNPFFEHGDAEYYVAERGGRVVGRIAAVENRAHNAYHGDQTGFFGFFECIDDAAVARSLFAAAAVWLKARGLDVMRGPTSFSTNDESGLLIDGFDSPPTILNPHNPAYYAPLLEQDGFTKAKDLYQYRVTNPVLPERLLERVQRIVDRQELTLRALDKRRFADEVERIKVIYNAAWERNWGF
ncbi:MAG: N-acetyltransferase, partial [Acidobacteria bacterium]|nr:N-acetyltransferase [Acidobacteriota bacterium]NIQ29482.1 N-acetyltransferase [Acidobacteriota bacterium]NIQ84147.1 N-acetyltransferase [Acidobacteriota bacterium]